MSNLLKYRIRHINVLFNEENKSFEFKYSEDCHEGFTGIGNIHAFRRDKNSPTLVSIGHFKDRINGISFEGWKKKNTTTWISDLNITISNQVQIEIQNNLVQIKLKESEYLWDFMENYCKNSIEDKELILDPLGKVDLSPFSFTLQSLEDKEENRQLQEDLFFAEFDNSKFTSEVEVKEKVLGITKHTRKVNKSID